jgi:predicted NAD-dependent protein-ADP-ribosyltransferase YbiA (DUF1768 family)
VCAFEVKKKMIRSNIRSARVFGVAILALCAIAAACAGCASQTQPQSVDQMKKAAYGSPPTAADLAQAQKYQAAAQARSAAALLASKAPASAASHAQ